MTVTEEDDQPWSQGIPVETRRAARALFLEGNRLFRVPLFARAAAHYTAALEQWPHPAFYFNLALAQLNLGEEVSARDNLERALQHGEEPFGADEYEEARQQLREIERQLGRVHISCKTRGAEVTMDGATLFTGPGTYQGWVKAGPHELTAKKSGYLSEARRVTVAIGALQELDLKLITLDEAADKNRRWAVWKPWLVVATGTAVAAGGGVFHALAARNFSAYDDAFLQLDCVKMESSTGCAKGQVPSSLSDQLSKARRQQIVAISSYAIGGALIATGAVLLYLNRPRLLEQETSRPSASQITVVPELSPDSLGIVLSVSH